MNPFYTSNEDENQITDTEPGITKTKVVILENPANLNAFLALKEREKKSRLVCVATTPEVSFLLEKHNEPYVSMDSYLGSDAISQLGMSNFDKVENVCNSLDGYLWKNFNRLEVFSLKPAQDNFQYIKVLYDVLTITISRLHAILEKEKPSIIITFSHSTDIIPLRDLPFHPEENLFDLMMTETEWDGRHMSIRETTSIPNNSRTGYTKTPPIISIRNRIQTTFPMIYSSIMVFQRLGGRGWLKFFKTALLKTGRKKKYLCISGYGYDWINILNDLADKNYSFIYTQCNGTNRENTTEKIPIPIQIVKNTCIYQNTDFSGIFLARLNTLLEKSLKVADICLPSIEKMMKKYKPCAVLCSTKSNFSDHITAHIAQKKGIPVISWQHGAAGFFCYPILKYVELDDSTIHLVWGSGVKEEIENDFPETTCKVIPVGSVFLNNEYTRRSDKQTNNILYVTTNYFHNSLYVGYAHNFQDITFWETQKGIINCLGSFSCNTVLKLHPGYSQHPHFSEYIKDNQFKNIKLIKNKPSFPTLLHNSDIVIIDFPSTTLLQAIAAKKTAFVLLKHLTLTDKAQYLLKKRAYCSEDLGEFLEMIHKYLNRESLEQAPDVNNTEFLEEYGITCKEGEISEKVIKILDDVCR